MLSFLSNLAKKIKGSKFSGFISFTEELEIEIMCANVLIIVSRLTSALSEKWRRRKGMLIFRYEAEVVGFPQGLLQLGEHFTYVNKAYCLQKQLIFTFSRF